MSDAYYEFLLPNVDFVFSHKCLFEILSVFLKTQIKLGQVSGSYLNPRDMVNCPHWSNLTFWNLKGPFKYR
jgi:hypothetical protein